VSVDGAVLVTETARVVGSVGVTDVVGAALAVLLAISLMGFSLSFASSAASRLFSTTDEEE